MTLQEKEMVMSEWEKGNKTRRKREGKEKDARGETKIRKGVGTRGRKQKRRSEGHCQSTSQSKALT